MRLTKVLLLALRISLCGIEKITPPPHQPLHRKENMMVRFRTTLRSMTMTTLLIHHLNIYIKSWLSVAAVYPLCNPLQCWQLVMGSASS